MLKQTIQEDLTQATKSSNEIIRDTLRMLLASVVTKEKEKRYKMVNEKPDLSEQELDKESELIDEEIISVVFSEVKKKKKEAILDFEKGERNDLAEKEKKEMEVLQKYLPEQLSEEELKKIVKEAIEKVGAQEIKDTGKIMAEVMPKVQGKADGKEISRIVRELLVSE